MATSKELKSGVDEALKIRDALQVALGQEGLTDAEFTSINNQYKAAVKTSPTSPCSIEANTNPQSSPCRKRSVKILKNKMPRSLAV